MYYATKLRLFLLALAILALHSPFALAEEPAIDGGRVRVQLVSRLQTTLSSEISAVISALPLREGEAFKKGASLVAFDCALLQAQLNKAEATAMAARQTLKVNNRLLELDSIGILEVSQAEAKVKETEAEVAAMQVMVSKCVAEAPFSGRIAKLYVDPHQYVTPGKPLMDILDQGSLEVRLIVPSRLVSTLREGGNFEVAIDELKKTYTAKLTRIGARIDPLSQSLPLTGEIVGSHPELLPGMSGWAVFKVK